MSQVLATRYYRREGSDKKLLAQVADHVPHKIGDRVGIHNHGLLEVCEISCHVSRIDNDFERNVVVWIVFVR